MKNIYIIQTQSYTMLSRTIKLATHNNYTHISLSLNLKMDKMYSFGRRQIYNMLNSGFVIESINSPFYKKFKNTKCRIYQLSIDERKYYNLKKMIKEFEKNPYKYNYDIIGLIIKKFNIEIKRKNKYVCSQFVGYLLSENNIYDFSKSSYHVMPYDFNDISNVIIYEGLLRDYAK